MALAITGVSPLPCWPALIIGDSSCLQTHRLCLTHVPAGMYTGMRTENRGDAGVLDAATLRQQRRLKQAIQFLHKDSADLLPLDGLKKLGTSKQGVRVTQQACSYITIQFC